MVQIIEVESSCFRPSSGSNEALVTIVIHSIVSAFVPGFCPWIMSWAKKSS